jgi:hypothetical protein
MTQQNTLTAKTGPGMTRSSRILRPALQQSASDRSEGWVTISYDILILAGQSFRFYQDLMQERRVKGILWPHRKLDTWLLSMVIGENIRARSATRSNIENHAKYLKFMDFPLWRRVTIRCCSYADHRILQYRWRTGITRMLRRPSDIDIEMFDTPLNDVRSWDLRTLTQ